MNGKSFLKSMPVPDYKHYSVNFLSNPWDNCAIYGISVNVISEDPNPVVIEEKAREWLLGSRNKRLSSMQWRHDHLAGATCEIHETEGYPERHIDLHISKQPDAPDAEDKTLFCRIEWRINPFDRPKYDSRWSHFLQIAFINEESWNMVKNKPEIRDKLLYEGRIRTMIRSGTPFGADVINAGTWSHRFVSRSQLP